MTHDPVAGTCYGFEVHSALPFHFLRAGRGDPLHVLLGSENGAPSELGPPLQEWKTEAPPGYSTRIYDEQGLYRVESSALGWFTVDPTASRISVPQTDQVIAREQTTLTTGTLLCFHARGDLPLHAACVEVDGEAIVLAAPGTFGKTTLAAGFWKLGYRVLCEDLVCLRRSSQPSVVPGPAMIRLRRDVAEWLDLPDSEIVVETDQRVCLSLDARRAGDCSPVPIRAVVLLLPSEEDPRLTRMDRVLALRDLWALCALFPTDEDFAQRFQAVADLVDRVPVYGLFRRKRMEDLEETVQRIASDV